MSFSDISLSILLPMAKLSFFLMANIPLWASQAVLVAKAPPAKRRRCVRHGLDPWIVKIPWRRASQPTLVFLPGESHGRGAWWRTVQRVCKESDTTERVSMHITGAMSHCVYKPDLFYPFTCRRTLALLPCVGCCQQSCCECRGACIFF